MYQVYEQDFCHHEEDFGIVIVDIYLVTAECGPNQFFSNLGQQWQRTWPEYRTDILIALQLDDEVFIRSSILQGCLDPSILT